MKSKKKIYKKLALKILFAAVVSLVFANISSVDPNSIQKHAAHFINQVRFRKIRKTVTAQNSTIRLIQLNKNLIAVSIKHDKRINGFNIQLKTHNKDVEIVKTRTLNHKLNIQVKKGQISGSAKNIIQDNNAFHRIIYLITLKTPTNVDDIELTNVVFTTQETESKFFAGLLEQS